MLKRPCQYFNTTGKCRFGKHCKFSHSSDTFQPESTVRLTDNHEAVKDSSETTTLASGFIETSLPTHSNNEDLRKLHISDSSEISPTDFVSQSLNKNNNEAVKQSSCTSEGSRKLCSFFAKRRFCHFGRRCRFEHVLPGLTDLRHEEKKTQETKNSSYQELEQKEVAPETTSADAGSKRSENEKVVADKESEEKPKSKKVCRFFRQGYCRFGESCNFYHPLKKSVEPILKLGDDAKKTNAEFTEVKAKRLQISQVYNVADVSDEKQKELRATEINQLKRRFPADKVQVLQDTNDATAIRFTFMPTDPDWPFDVKAFDIQVSLPSDYPLKTLDVELPLDQDLPETVRRYIEVSLKEWITHRAEDGAKQATVELVFRSFLRWMDRNLENIVTEGLKQLRRELTARAAGLEFIPAKELQQKLPPSQASAYSDDQGNREDIEAKDTRRMVAYRKGEIEDKTYEGPEFGTDSNQHSDNDEAESEEDDEDHIENQEGGNDEKVHQRPIIAADTERRGTELSFRNMQIWYCTTVLVERVRLVIQCERCKNQTDFSTPPNRVNSVPCSKCNATQLVVYRPVLAHSYSSTFGYLDLDECTAFDVVLQDCHISMGCIMCSRDILVKTFCPGRVMDIFCRGCHNKMQFAAESAKVHRLTEAGVDASKYSGAVYKVSVRKLTRVIKDPAIQEGKALPDNGACKHYKKSFRWLRFPCCGKAYPCDLCHNDKEDHEMKFANRMICGYCCREQAYASERPCVGCSSSLTKVRTAHWEGGKGCRNRIAMSKNDEKKYKNMNKTVSNKAKTTEEKKAVKVTKLRHA
ncbi:uncharacterized protein LOC127879356 [Dreissena polymorpha]|uniref:Nucleoporin NUP42 n=1 Tax=Dreissena polymorpha TaxID=45954 RepID=A0A9D4KID2_DREPO|nr:uncharacterized protein LOC127879356 [Dreissena polymorpha]KAH3840515.1 hypothetical protein DPMN_113965 [Dreissena polymorpha]